MARGELLRRLFANYARHDDQAFRAAALEIISEEEQKQNHALAKDLLGLLEHPAGPPTHPLRPSISESLPQDRDRNALLVQPRRASRTLSEIVLREGTRGQLVRILDEYRRSELLRIHGLRPKTKLLFCGPPGCGKSLCAEIIAAELNRPLLYTRFDAVVSSFLGETSSNLRKVFDYVRTGNWVLLFDEFDAIGKSRSDPGEHGELKRVVNSFLQLLDDFDGNSVIIAATNHEELLDNALWRRFDEIFRFERPNVDEIRLLLSMKLKGFPVRSLNITRSATRLRGLSHAEIEWACFDAVKTAILNDEDAVTQEILDDAIARLKERARIGASVRRRRPVF